MAGALRIPSRIVRRRARLALCCAAVACLAVPAQVRASDPVTTLGVYRGAGNPSAISAWEAWIGQPAAAVTDYFARASWEEIENPWVAGQWGGSGRRIVYGLAMLPSSEGTLAEAATGAYNEHFRRVAEQLVASGQPDAVLRIGLEFNGSWFPWSVGVENGSADFAAAWRAVVKTIRAVPGARFEFDWCPTLGGSWFEGSQVDPALAYPGDAYVDYVGLDVYDHDWMPGWRDPVRRWANLKNQKYGLIWHRNFARVHGKPMSFPEWGLAERADGHGGGDSPYFVEMMYRWIAVNDVAYHNYFEFDEADANHELIGGQFPAAAKRFRRLFSGDLVTTATTVTTLGRPHGGKVRGRVIAHRGSADLKGKRVSVSVQRRVGRRWQAVRRVSAKLTPGGSYARRFRLPVGRYRTRVRFRGSASMVRSRSPYRRFTVGG